MARHRLFRRRTNWDRARDNMHIIVTVLALVATVFGWSAISNTEQPLASTDRHATPRPSQIASSSSEPAAPTTVVETPPPAQFDDTAPAEVVEPPRTQIAQAAPTQLSEPPPAPIAAPLPVVAAVSSEEPVVPPPLPRAKPIVQQRLQPAIADVAPQRATRAMRAEPQKVRRQVRASRFAQARESQSVRRQMRRHRAAHAQRQVRRVKRVVPEADDDDEDDGSYRDPFNCSVRKQHPCFRE